jgi:nicotinamidase/pyrazinamidase
VTTQDWHPQDHCSFADNGGLWPVHCVQDSDGASLHPELKVASGCSVFKGGSKGFDSYSGFKDDGGAKTPLETLLRDNYIDEVYVCGLATDYCVKFTALDSIGVGFKTSVVVDACRGVNVNEGDVDKALEEMKEAGIALVESEDI